MLDFFKQPLKLGDFAVTNTSGCSSNTAPFHPGFVVKMTDKSVYMAVPLFGDGFFHHCQTSFSYCDENRPYGIFSK